MKTIGGMLAIRASRPSDLTRIDNPARGRSNGGSGIISPTTDAEEALEVPPARKRPQWVSAETRVCLRADMAPSNKWPEMCRRCKDCPSVTSSRTGRSGLPLCKRNGSSKPDDFSVDGIRSSTFR